MLHRHQHHPDTVADRVDALMRAVMVHTDVTRLAQIAAQVTDDFVYITPGGVFDGVEGLSDCYGRYRHDSRPAVLRRTSVVDLHHAQFRYTWELTEPGMPAREGWSFGTLAGDGRLARIVTFNGLVPATP
jgi:hypothetical protein